ncbi:hypothetical protein U9M48_036573 [Paspalum notatum var. saurae]|uniref:Protein FAR1-RELATED SEQUENCE n=1 Tax=Paspalum notatum var. saurae TaxID=547442 RepID=A0AAQ3UDE3_PASNO
MVQTPGRTSTQGKARIVPGASRPGGRSDAAILQHGRASPSGRNEAGGDWDARRGFIRGKQESCSTHGHQELDERMDGVPNQGSSERCRTPKSSLCPTKSTIGKPKSPTKLARKLFSSEAGEAALVSSAESFANPPPFPPPNPPPNVAREAQGLPDAAVRLGSLLERNSSRHEKQATRLNDAMYGATTASHLRTPASGGTQVGGTEWRAEVSPPATINAADFGTPSDDRTYTHEDTIDPSLVPRIGMSFRNEDEAKEFFRIYAQEVGFAVSMGNGKTHSRVIHCNKVGKGEYFKKEEGLHVRNNTSKKSKCKVKLKLKRVFGINKVEECVVIEQAHLDHNHELNGHAANTSQMPCHKTKDAMVLDVVDETADKNVPNRCINNMMRDMHTGVDKVPLTFRDLENRKAKKLREDHIDDISKVLEFFKQCQSDNPKFCWDVKLDKQGTIHSLFWSHASMQGEYLDFGDAMSFDTTHKTNLYDKPLAMFVSGNNYLKNTLFGCALLGDETIETFRWVFQAFKRCMRKNRTKTILTDQDQAMAVAVEKEFPGVIHRICRWHVVNKHTTHLNELYALHEKRSFREKFNSVLNHPLTPSEFEAAWDELLTECELHNDPTLIQLYEDREKFIPAYFKGDYCGRMTSTQCSESMNFSMKNGYIGKQTYLHRFAMKTLNYMDDLRLKHAYWEYLGTSKCVTKSKWPFEIQVSRIYSRPVFKDFEEKMVLCSAYNIVEDVQTGSHAYLVQHTNKTNKITWDQ